LFTFGRTLLAAALAVVGCRSQAPAAPSSPTSQTQQPQAVKPRPATRGSAIAIRIPAKGGAPAVYRLPGLQEMPSVLRGRLPPVASVVGLDPESEMLFATTAKGEVLGYDLESGRVDTVAAGVEQAALGPDGTLFTVDTKKRVVSVERRVRFAWPQPLAATPRQLFGASDGRLIAIVTQDQPRVITAASDQPPAVRDLLLSGDVAITRWGELLAVASDSGVTLLDPYARRAPAFVPLADHPRALAFSPAGHRLYVARRTSPGLAVIDRFERKEIDGVALPLPAANLRVDGFGRWLLARPAAGRGERVDQWAAVLHPVILVKRMDHGAGVTAGRRRIGAGGIGLPGDRVDRSRRRAVPPPLPWRLACLSQPERVVASLGPCRPIPRHSYCLQEPEPAEELIGIGTYRRRRAVARCEITQELRHRRHLGAGPVHQPVGHWSLRDLLDPAGP